MKCPGQSFSIVSVIFNGMYKVRQFRESDLPLVMELVGRTINERYKPELFMNAYHRFPNGFILMEDVSNNALIGALLAVPVVNNALRILILTVAAPYRRKRIGTELLGIAKRIAISNKLTKITLEVRVDNLPAIEFYKRNGFTIVGVIPKYYTDGSSGYAMEKPLY